MWYSFMKALCGMVGRGGWVKRRRGGGGNVWAGGGGEVVGVWV